MAPPKPYILYVLVRLQSAVGYSPVVKHQPWVLPPLSNSWIIIIIWLYIALDRTPNIDCYWGGQYPTQTLNG